MKAKTQIFNLEITSTLGQRALKSYIKKVLEKEGLLTVKQLTAMTAQQPTDEEEFSDR